MNKLKCEMRKECESAVTHIDSSGFVYCEFHGNQRKNVKRCRKLSVKELKLLIDGIPLPRYTKTAIV